MRCQQFEKLKNMEGIQAVLVQMGFDPEPAQALAHQLWDIAQRLERTPEEQALAGWFASKLRQLQSK